MSRLGRALVGKLDVDALCEHGLALAVRLGVSVEVEPGSAAAFERYLIRLEAPAGRRFGNHDCHELIVSDFAAAKRELHAAVLVDCDDPHCEWCGRPAEPQD